MAVAVSSGCLRGFDTLSGGAAGGSFVSLSRFLDARWYARPRAAFKCRVRGSARAVSVRIMSEVWARSSQKGSALLVLVALADNANDEGECWPSIRTIARKSRMSERQVLRIVHDIAAAGELEITTTREGRSTKNLYRIIVGDGSHRQLVTVNGGFTVTNQPVHGDIAMSPEPKATSTSRELRSLGERSENRTFGAGRGSDTEGAGARNTRPTSRERPRDPIWDELVALFGAEAAGLERGRWNAACKSLRASGATAETLRAAATVYRTHPSFAECVMTPTALAANWTILAGNGKTADDLRKEKFRARIAAFDARTNGETL